MKKATRNPRQVGSVEKRIIHRLREFTQALENGEDISRKFTSRQLQWNFKVGPYEPDMVIETRKLLGVDRLVFAMFLGVSAKTVQAWEEGIRPPTKLACRFM